MGFGANRNFFLEMALAGPIFGGPPVPRHWVAEGPPGGLKRQPGQGSFSTSTRYLSTGIRRIALPLRLWRFLRLNNTPPQNM